jgi:hypothetical protein
MCRCTGCRRSAGEPGTAQGETATLLARKVSHRLLVPFRRSSCACMLRSLARTGAREYALSPGLHGFLRRPDVLVMTPLGRELRTSGCSVAADLSNPLVVDDQE